MKPSGVFVTIEELESVRLVRQTSGIRLHGHALFGDPEIEVDKLIDKYGLQISAGLDMNTGQFWIEGEEAPGAEWTDRIRFFSDSPNCGDPAYFCSICVKPIDEPGTLLRMWRDSDRAEARFHKACIPPGIGIQTLPEGNLEDEEE